MIAAVQPFISGAISKTVNLTNEAAVDDIKNVYVEAWKLGVKCMSIYRDGSKSSQPLSSNSQDDTLEEKLESHDSLQPIRKRLPDERQSVTHKFSVAGHDGYITVGFYDDGSPGEVFLKMSKEGSVISGLIDTIATMTSILLQYGVPLESLVDKFSHVRFEPSGFTSNQDIPIAKSIIDYVFRWLGQKFLSQNQVDTEVQETFGNQIESTRSYSDEADSEDLNAVSRIMPLEGQLELREKQVAAMQSDAPPCQACGSIMVRNGTCYRCLNCGATSGCS
jgi:ribonucleoside-diphosphate reductase alpha chain